MVASNLNTGNLNGYDLTGQRIKGYVLRESLGSGGFGAVYRAYQEDVQREVAIKIILPRYANQPDFIRRFEAEAQTIAQLEHPYIVPLYDYWRDPHGAYLVMRLLRGGSIRDVLRQHRLFDIERIAVLLGHIGSALHHAHQQQVIHRDIKPDNILLDESGIAYLADFGIAKNLSRNGNGASKEIVGSLDYLSPEQARSEPITARTDIYSLGVVLYELLAGEHPFHEVSSVERMYKHISDPLPEITSLEPDLNEAMNEIIQRATQKNPKDRYPDVLSLARDFAEAAQMTVSSPKSIYETLTSRELDILRLVADDLTNQEIAEKLVVEHSTIRWYIRQINKKLRVFSREELKRKVAELGWFDEETSPTNASPSQIELLWDEVDNPYKGLRAFERGEAQDFFGREEFIERLIWRMQQADPYARFLVIVGPSGSGKSSVARAGLLPALVKNAIGGSDHWFCIDMIPGDSPFDALETALTRIAADQAMNLHEHLNRDERGLVRAADLILPKDKSEILLLIDQFEEVFTLVTDEGTRRRFLDLLRATVTAPHSRVRIVATLRADFYDRPLQYPHFGEMLRARMETILPLTAQGIERAIVGPVERMGMVFDDGLVAQIVSETTYQAGALPLLQFALTALFDLREAHKLTHEAYQKIGGVGGALANRIEDIYHQLDLEAQEAVRQLFLRLVTLGEGVEDTRRRVPRSELVAVSNNSDLMEDLIDFLAQERFLALDNDPASRASMVEVAHEAILREWERLRAWINDNRAELRMQQQLGRLVEDWHRANQEPSYLLRGARLTQFEDWSKTTTLSLTPTEHEFLQASQQARDEHLAEEQQRKQHEAALENRTKRVLQVLAIVLFLAAIGGFALAAFAFDREQRAQQALISVETAESEARELALINGANAAYQGGDIQTGLTFAVAANSIENSPALAQATLSEIAYHPGPMRRLGDEFEFALSLDISADGEYLLADRKDFAVVLWNLETGERVHEMTGHEGNVLTVDISPDGTQGVSIAEDQTIILWDLETGQMLRRFGNDHLLSPVALSVTFSPDGKSLLSNNGGLPMLDPDLQAKLILWDVETATPIREYGGHTKVVGRPAFSQDGSMILSGGAYEEFILWDVDTGEIIRRREELSTSDGHVPVDIIFRPDGKTALALFWDSSAILLDIDTLETLQTYGVGGTGFGSWSEIALAPDGETLYLNNPERTGQGFWDVETGEMIEALTDTGSRMTYGAAFAPDGKSLIFSQDGVGIIAYAINHGAEVRSFPFDSIIPPQEHIISPDGSLLYVRVSDGQACQIIIYDLVSGSEISRYDFESDLIKQLGCDPRQYPVFYPDGQSVFARSADGEGILWDVSTGEILSRIPDFPSGRIEIADDGSTVLVVTDNSNTASGSVEISEWDLSSGTQTQLLPLPGNFGSINMADFSSDGQYILTSDGASSIYMDVSTGEIIRELSAPVGGMLAAVFSPDDQLAVTIGSGLGEMIIWDLESGTLISSWNAGTVKYAEVTPDGRYIVTVGQRVSLWDVQTGEEIRRYTDASGSWFHPHVLPDGQSFLIRDMDINRPAIRQWRIDTDENFLDWVYANRYVRDLTCAERDLYRIKPLCEEETN